MTCSCRLVPGVLREQAQGEQAIWMGVGAHLGPCAHHRVCSWLDLLIARLLAPSTLNLYVGDRFPEPLGLSGSWGGSSANGF